MTTPFRQPIVPHDRGGDVLATKRALRTMGYGRVGLTRSAGPLWESAIRAIQHNHALTVDGIYGPKTHAIVAVHFDRYGVWLYTHAKIRKRSAGYQNPFPADLVQGRVDEGVDYFGRGPIKAIGDAVICGVNQGWWVGWPGNTYIYYRLTSGRHAGRYIYIAEGIKPALGLYRGKHVKAGDTICSFGWNAAPGIYPGIETGWSSATGNITWAAASHQLTPPPFNDTAPGMAFARFLRAIGAPAPDTGKGPEFV